MEGRRVSGLLLLGLVSAACRDPTEVTLEISTDVKCNQLKETTVTPGSLGPVESLPFATSTDQCTEGTKENAIGSIVLFPSGDKNGSFGVKIVAGVDVPAEECAPPAYKGCIVARRAMSYAPHTPLTLPVILRASCKDVVCDPSSTCVQGGCVSATVPNPSDCTGDRCSETVLQGSTGGQPGSGGRNGVIDSGAGGSSSGAGGADSGISSGSGGTGGSGAGGTSVVDSGGGTAAPDASLRDASVPADASIRDAASLTDARADAAPLACTAPLADCNGIASDGCETDTSTDGLNCGRCKVSCFGATCTAGLCAPVTVATATAGTSSPYNVAADEANVYWTDHTANVVMQQPLAGGNPIKIASGLANPYGIAVDSTHVYWTAYGINGSIQRAPIGGGGPVQTIAAANSAYYVTVDSSYVYWGNNLSNGTVQRAPKDATAATPTTLASGQQFPLMVVVDAPSFYWSNWANNDGVYVRPLDLSALPSQLTTVSKSPYAITKYGSDVYFTTDVGGDITQVHLGGAVTTIVSAEKKPLSILADASGVYWANNGSGAIRKLPPGSTFPVTLASNQIGVRSIAMSSNSLFWQTSSGVMRLGR